MKFKIVVVLAYITLIMGFNTDVRIKRQILKIPSLTGLTDSAFSNLGSGLASGFATTTTDIIQKGLSKVVSSGTGMIGSGAAAITSIGLEGVRTIGDRVQGAIKNTYQEEKDSVKSSWDSVKNTVINGIEAGANLTKTIFDLGTLGPKLGKNLISG